jgi:hypothetical protein
VEVGSDGGERVRYVRHPFKGEQDVFFDVTSVTYKWATFWERGRGPA